MRVCISCGHAKAKTQDELDQGFSPQTSGGQYKTQQEPRVFRRDGAQPEKAESYSDVPAAAAVSSSSLGFCSPTGACGHAVDVLLLATEPAAHLSRAASRRGW